MEDLIALPPRLFLQGEDCWILTEVGSHTYHPRKRQATRFSGDGRQLGRKPPFALHAACVTPIPTPASAEHSSRRAPMTLCNIAAGLPYLDRSHSRAADIAGLKHRVRP